MPMTPPSFIWALAYVLSLAGVLLTGWRIWVALRAVQTQLRITVFSEYTKRYSAIAEKLPFDARRPGEQRDIERLQPADKEKALNAMRLYFNLCSEEFFLQQERLLDKRTWEIWQTGMRDAARLPYFASSWEYLRQEYEFYGDFLAFMDELQGSSQARRVRAAASGSE